jgi:hypothetical protein
MEDVHLRFPASAKYLMMIHGILTPFPSQLGVSDLADEKRDDPQRANN